MQTVKLKERLGRPRVFTIINKEGKEDSLRFNARQSQDVDARILTSEIIKNIENGALIVLDGNIPKELNPYALETSKSADTKNNADIKTQPVKKTSSTKTKEDGE